MTFFDRLNTVILNARMHVKSNRERLKDAQTLKPEILTRETIRLDRELSDEKRRAAAALHYWTEKHLTGNPEKDRETLKASEQARNLLTDLDRLTDEELTHALESIREEHPGTVEPPEAPEKETVLITHFF